MFIIKLITNGFVCCSRSTLFMNVPLKSYLGIHYEGYLLQGIEGNSNCVVFVAWASLKMQFQQ